jgi:hypothetical protein
MKNLNERPSLENTSTIRDEAGIFSVVSVLFAKLALVMLLVILVLRWLPYPITRMIAHCAGFGMLLFSATTFLAAIFAIISISVSKKLTYYTPAVVAIVISLLTPFYIVLVPPSKTVKEREEAAMNDTAEIQLRKVGNSVIQYAKDHNNLLPDADNWRDLLLKSDHKLAKEDFLYPGVYYDCKITFNDNLDGLCLDDIHNNTILLIQANADWNLTDGKELLNRKLGKDEYIYMILLDGRIIKYWLSDSIALEIIESPESKEVVEFRWEP